MVSVVHVDEGPVPGPKRLDGREVETITAFLFHRGGHDDPARLAANAGKSFQGSIVLGMGFTFDDTDTKGVATPLAEMQRLIAKDPRNHEVIFPYIGGEEVNTSPTHAHHRYVINFGERERGGVSRRWPDLMAIVESEGEAGADATNDARQYPRTVKSGGSSGTRAQSCYAAIAGLERVLVIAHVEHSDLAFTFLPAGMRLLASSSSSSPSRLTPPSAPCSPRPHEIWARFFGSSLKDDLRYTPSDCFETFPFPESWETHPALEAAGKAYYEFRAALMVREQRGPDQDLQPLPRSRRARPGDPEAPRAARRHGPRRARRLRLERHPDRLRVPPRLRDRRGGVGRQEEALSLPLARRGPRRGAGPPPRAQRRAREGRSPLWGLRTEERRRKGSEASTKVIATRGWRPLLVTSPLRKWKGARWWKCDLHAHTPASDDYGKGPQQAVFRARTPEEWLFDYMRAEIDCVAVTDHNSGEWVVRVQEALKGMVASKPEGYRPLCVFPGAEISVNGGVHVLAMLGSEKTTADIDSLLGAVGFSGAKGSSDSVTSKSFKDVVAAIASAGGLTIPAHADRESGLFTLTGNTLLQALDCQEVAAIEIVDKTTAKPPIYTQAKVRWTELIGSDSHHPTGQPGHRFPGSHFTWVKMGAPSLDGLRLAFRDGPLSVRRGDSQADDPNSHANLVLESVEVSQARYMGRPDAFCIELNPWLNAIVGGRGTGKSSIVEFLRLALGRESELPEDLGNEFEKYSAQYASRGDIGLLTENTRIVVTYAKDGARFRIEREPASGKAASIQEERDGQWHSVEGDVMQRFPVRIYSQKQIFQLAKTPLALLRIVDDSPAVNYRKWAEGLSTLTNEYMAHKATLRQLTAEAAEESRLKGELDDVTRRLGVFETSGHTDVLSKYRSSIQAQATVSSWKETWAEVGAKIRNVADEITQQQLDLTGDFAQPAEDAKLSRRGRRAWSTVQGDTELTGGTRRSSG